MLSCEKWSSKIPLLCLVIGLLTAIGSEGFHHFDEHFQVFEFLNWKLGNTPNEALPWEFHEHIRSWIIPGLLYPMAKLYFALGFESPFALATFFRLLFSGFAFWCTHRLLLSVEEQFPTTRWYRLAYLLTQCSWFIPYIHARTSSENASLALMFLALSLIFSLPKTGPVQWPKLLVIGFLIGLCFHIRYQMALAMLGGLGYLLVFRRSWVLGIIAGFVVALGLGVGIDRWGYGQWVLASWDYFYQTLVLDRHSSFGVTAWWDYLRLLLLRGIPPWSIVYFVGTCLFFWKNPRHLFTWTCVPFFILHSLIGHKELRFLYYMICLSPLMLAMVAPILIAKFQQWMPNRLQNPLIKSSLKKFFWGGQIILLLIIILSPAQNAIAFYRFVFQNQQIPSTLWSTGGNPFQLVTLRPWFYLPKIPQVEEKTLRELEQAPSAFWVFLNRGEHFMQLQKAKQQTCTQVFGTYPSWVWDTPLANILKSSRIWMVASCPHPSPTT